MMFVLVFKLRIYFGCVYFYCSIRRFYKQMSKELSNRHNVYLMSFSFIIYFSFAV